MTDRGRGVEVVGAEAQAASLALLLATGGAKVRLHVPDPADAARLRDGLGRSSLHPAVAASLSLGSGRLDVTGAAHVFVAPDSFDPVALEKLLSSEASLTLLRCDPAPVAPRLRHPVRLFALHPAGPLGSDALVELIDQPGVRQDVKARLEAVLRAAGLTVVGAQDSGAGTLAQRLALRLGDAVEAVLLSGVAPWELDAAFVALGAARGPLESQDLAGLDGAFALRRRRARRLRAAGLPVPATPAQDRMVAEGRLGKAAGVGWYRYPGGGGAVIDPLLEDLIAEEAHFARHPRPGVAPAAAAEIAVAALLDEGARALADGTAATVGAFDLTAAHLLSLPAAGPGLRALGAAMGARGIEARLAALRALGTDPSSAAEPRPDLGRLLMDAGRAPAAGAGKRGPGG